MHGVISPIQNSFHATMLSVIMESFLAFAGDLNHLQ